MTPPPPSLRPHGNPVVTAVPVSGTGRYQDKRVDVKLVLSGMWIAMLFVSAYVDIFAFFRKDVLRAGLDGRISGMTQPVDQMLLIAALLYILVPSLMVVLSLILRPMFCARRCQYLLTLSVFVLGGAVTADDTPSDEAVKARTAQLEQKAKAVVANSGTVVRLLGSAVEVVLLLAIARTARKWPRQPLAS